MRVRQTFPGAPSLEKLPLFSRPVPAGNKRLPLTNHIQRDIHPFLSGDIHNKEMHFTEVAFPKPLAVGGDRMGYGLDAVRERATGFNYRERCALSLFADVW